MNKRYLLIAFLILSFAFISADADAQCAMCKAVAESATDEHGNHSAGGINTGIVYMMGIPYLLLGFLALVFFREKIGSFLKEFRSIHS
jgi:hypothetical protein